MGVSIMAIVAYGVDFGDEGDPKEAPWDDFSDDSFEDWVASVAGVNLENVDYNAYFKACPVELIHLGPYERDGRILAVRGTEQDVYLGNIKRIDGKMFALEPERLHAAIAFCELNGIPFDNPSWLLAVNVL